MLFLSGLLRKQMLKSHMYTCIYNLIICCVIGFFNVATFYVYLPV